MSNFDDFDLDLKRVASEDNGKARGLTSEPCLISQVTIKLSELSIKNCKSFQNPTTGMTVGCCYKEAAPRCV